MLLAHHFSIELRFIDPPDEDPAMALDPPAIGYVLEPTGASGGKLRDRFVIRPDLDLGRYTVDAKLDWVRVGLTTGRRTNWKSVQGEVERFTGSTPDVNPAIGDHGRAHGRGRYL